MDIETFRNLPTQDIVRIVREAGTKTLVFPIKGTRRWFLLEYPDTAPQDFAVAYLQATISRHVVLYKMIFDHGIETILAPMFDTPLLQRGERYMQMAAQGMRDLATHPAFLDFYKTNDVRVRFYGDYHKHLSGTAYAYLIEDFDTIESQTARCKSHRIFYGMFVEDATETIAKITLDLYRDSGVAPDKKTLVESYYGEHITPVDLFISFGKLRTFDMPLLNSRAADLYFTVSPSLYLTRPQLRDILYDHLYARQRSPLSYQDLSPEGFASMRAFYHGNIGKTLGVGWRDSNWFAWCPLPQVKLTKEPI